MVLKFLALLQISLLLSTSLVPGGNVRLMTGSCCGDSCGCTAADRQSGNCCCARGDDATTSGEEECCQSDKTELPPCCAKAKARSESTDPKPCVGTCCQKQSSIGACCSSKTADRIAASEEPLSESESNGIPVSGEVVNCPCGGDSFSEIAVHMPRVQPLRATLLIPCEIPESFVSGDEFADPQPLPPPRRPPRVLA